MITLFPKPFDTTTDEGKLAVMQAKVEGLEIETKVIGFFSWHLVTDPLWRWHQQDYRIAPGQDEKVNEFIASCSGYGLRIKVVDTPTALCGCKSCVAGVPSACLCKDKVPRRVPCGPQDFPPGLCCVKRNLDSQCRVVIRTSPEGFEAAGWDFRFFSDLVGDTVVRSLDGGKTWLPCWKEVV